MLMRETNGSVVRPTRRAQPSPSSAGAPEVVEGARPLVGIRSITPAAGRTSLTRWEMLDSELSVKTTDVLHNPRRAATSLGFAHTPASRPGTREGTREPLWPLTDAHVRQHRTPDSTTRPYLDSRARPPSRLGLALPGQAGPGVAAALLQQAEALFAEWELTHVTRTNRHHTALADRLFEGRAKPRDLCAERARGERFAH